MCRVLAAPPLAPPPLTTNQPDDARGGLLASLQGGNALAGLRSVAAAPAAAPPPADDRGGLMAQISEGGFKLKKVDRSAPKAPVVQPSSGLMGALGAAMAQRRMAQRNDGSDDDDDWESIRHLDNLSTLSSFHPSPSSTVAVWLGVFPGCNAPASTRVRVIVKVHLVR